MGCFACGRGFHKECIEGCKRCHAGNDNKTTNPSYESVENENPDAVKDESPDSPRVPKKSNLKDPSSTGRKRAARLYPINPGDPCEWRGKKNCGGGLRPIIGCYEGLQEHRHHGPVKRTTRNELGNVHRICSDCHVHWHELNDLIYDEANFDLLPHDPVDAELTEIMQNILDWKSGEMGRRFELASSQNLKKAKENESI
jgi:hypothetical protein